MPKIAKIPANIEIQNGYAFAAVVDGKVIAAVSLNVGAARDLAKVDAQAVVAAPSEAKDVVSAQKAYDAAWEEYQASGDDDEAVNLKPVEMAIRFGMVSGGEFTHTFSANDAKRAGLPKGWF